MAVTEQQIYQALGLEQPAEVPAEQDSEETTAGAKDQEVAEPETAETGADETKTAEDTAEPEKKEELSQAQRRENAAKRRQQEQEAAISKAVEKAVQAEREKNDAAMADFFKKAGLKNSITGEAITNLAEFQAWRDQFDAKQIEKSLKSGNVSAELLQKVIDEHPTVKKANEMIAEQEKQVQAQKEKAEKDLIDGEIAEIHKMDPSINAVADLLAMENSKEFQEYVAKGYSFLDSFKLANYEKISSMRMAAEKQRMINNQRGKEHLTPEGNARGTGMVSVPSDELQMFRILNPNASEAQIQEFYNKYHKK